MYKNQNYTNKTYSNEKSKKMNSIRMKSIQIEIVEKEKQSSKSTVFLTKPNRKCTQPNKKVVLLDSRCT